MNRQDNGIIDWISHHLFSCPIKTYTGLDCPGCGLQRSLVALLKGDLLESFKLYPATIPLIFLILFTSTHLKFDFKHGARLIKFLFIGIASIILISYIYKINSLNLF